MTRSSIFHFCIILLFASPTTQTSSFLGLHQQDNKHVALFVFGDSLFDPGNNNYINTNTSFQANFWPYGETFFKYPTGRFCDGRLIPDFIAEYAKLPLIPPYSEPGSHHHFAYGANFASGGAGALVETFPGMVINLKTQLKYFNKVEQQLRQELGERRAKQLLSNAVYLLNIGGNDYISPSTVFHSYSQEEYVKIVIGNMTAVIKGIYETGGRKFGFLNMIPLGCLPSIRGRAGNNGDCMPEITALVKLHNKALPKSLKNLEKKLKGFMYSTFDFYSAASERIDNPSKYGFTEGKTACCGSGPYGGVSSCGGKRGIEEFELCKNPSKYLFFDFSHCSERAYQQFAELMWIGSPNATWPYNNNLKLLFERYTPWDNIITRLVNTSLPNNMQ